MSVMYLPRQSGLNRHLDRFEKGLRKKIKTSQASFLGLHQPYASLSDMIQRRLGDLESGARFDRFCDGLCRWPALFSSFLVHSLREDYGSESTSAVYPFLKEMMGCDLDTGRRKKLYRCFREACLALGLQVNHKTNGPVYMVREYLCQTGMPGRVVKRLTVEMMAFAQKVGLPDPDDLEELKAWQGQFVQVRGQYFSELIRLLLTRDQEAFYCRTFVENLLVERGEERDENAFMVEVAREVQALKLVNQNPLKAAKLPRLMWHNGTYGLELPDMAGAVWSIYLDGEQWDLQTHSGGLFWELTYLDFQEIQVHLGEDPEPLWKATLWPDGKRNLFLIFHLPSGKYSGRGRLFPQKKALDEAWTLDAGDYCIVSRFPPNGCDAAQLSHSPDIYVCRISLPADKTVYLENGPSSAVLQGGADAVLSMEGELFLDIHGEGFYGDAHLRVTLPKQQDGAMYELTWQAGENKGTFLVENEVISWQHLMEDLADGLHACNARLHCKGNRRALARISAYVWKGLTFVDKGVVFHGKATNLVETRCDNLLPGEGCWSYASRVLGTFTLTFQLPHKETSFTFRVPGLKLSQVEWEGSTWRETFLQPGCVLSVRRASRKYLRIYGHYMGELSLGAFHRDADFREKGFVEVSLAHLLEYVVPGAHHLVLNNDEGATELLSLCRPHTVQDFSIRFKGSEVLVLFNLSRKAHRVRLSFTNLLTNQRWDNLYLANDPNDLYTDHHRVFFDVDESGKAGTLVAHQLRIEAVGFHPGMYAVEMELLLHTWGRPQTKTGQQCVVFFDNEGKGMTAPLSGTRLVLEYPCVNVQQNIERFRTLNRFYQRSFSTASVESFPHLPKAIDETLQLVQLEELSQEQFCLLLRAVMMRPRDDMDDRACKVPTALAMRPELLCQPITRYGTMPDGRARPVWSGLLQLLQVSAGYGELAPIDLFRKGCFNLAFYVGFIDVEHIQRAGLHGAGHRFDFPRYKQAMEKVRERRPHMRRWSPGPGDFLGALHLRHALNRLEDRFEHLSSGDDKRLGAFLYWAQQKCGPALDALLGSLFNKFERSHWLHDARHFLDETKVDITRLRSVRRLLSVFAKVCRFEVRQPGCLRSFMQYLNLGEDCTTHLSLLLLLGGDLLAFYLMLWEFLQVTSTGGPHE